MNITYPQGFLNDFISEDLSADSYFIDKMINRILKGEYVLVVGNEMMLNPKGSGGYSNSMNYFVAATCGKLSSYGRLRVDPNEYDSFNKLELEFKRTRQAYLEFLGHLEQSMDRAFLSKRNMVLSSIDQQPKEYKALLNMYNPALLKLIRGKSFRIVLTTTTDPLLEGLMRETWGDELQVKSIFGDTSEEKDFSHADIDGREYYPYPPTLYYVFGKADFRNPETRFVLTENDIIECISRWLGNDRPKNLFKFIMSKRLLALGCRLDDWCFRFFWHALRQDTEKSHGDVVLSINENKESDRRLRSYFKEQNIHLEDKAEKFVEELVERLSVEEMEKNIRQHNKYEGIFISYASEDRAIALSIFRHLIEAGFNVWMDIWLEGGDDYEKRIDAAIKQCKVFVPLLTDQARRDLESGIADRWYQKEWQKADGDNVPWLTVPVQAFGYDCRKPYHNKTSKKIFGASVFDWKNRPISELIDRISTEIRKYKKIIPRI